MNQPLSEIMDQRDFTVEEISLIMHFSIKDNELWGWISQKWYSQYACYWVSEQSGWSWHEVYKPLTEIMDQRDFTVEELLLIIPFSMQKMELWGWISQKWYSQYAW